MLDRVAVDEAVRELRPDFAVLVVIAEGLANGPGDHVSEGWLADAATKADANDPHVEAWHEAYRAFGAKPKRTRPSVDALLRRGGSLPSINRVVDAYNAVSVEYALPIGGEDLDAYQGAARLVRATGDEPFDVVVDGEPAVDHPDPGEVVWRDDAGVTCRRWNWRQCVRTRLTETTKNGFFLLERLEPYPMERLTEAGERLTELLREIAPDVRVTSRLVGGP
ncbi:DNA/RNA-binding domain of Phe-tRNA-synthetase-like protein [Actinomadura pelletieri DSM 43383]|uniref:DNA/RNA-binding domain of Phe-tRNA-synthetase-like protein n=1 Tax=Actinomadura pelletieri DSM 43383 TaxID=1120940 RepID=A0A495QZH9_9ACTN|nr:phenylalanine--tRNA ligase beta subunit-related protein [Actinomadura pelletieri]RKS79354.1 DNA/RNA-binding domain of Phe-tRNA-synthetase-like protein [Actinomadura pelletieri DSM 43383]